MFDKAKVFAEIRVSVSTIYHVTQIHNRKKKEEDQQFMKIVIF